MKIGKTLAIAESCTGGKLAEHLQQHPGASAFFKGKCSELCNTI